MHKGIFLTALAAMLSLGSTALAERADGDKGRGMDIKREVLEKQRAGFQVRETSGRSERTTRTPDVRDGVRPRGDMVDRPTRTSKAAGGASRAHNGSATGAVNTPSEIRAMQKRINPMHGAYRMAAGDGTDSYGRAGSMPMVTRGSDGRVRNMSAAGAVNTPSEIRQMLRMINPMHGAYRMAAGDGTDSYGGKSHIPQAYGRDAFGRQTSASTRQVHMRNERGEVMSSTRGNTAAAMKNQRMRDAIQGMIKAKMGERARITGR